MITDPILAEDIRYNPASSCFEARVTVHGAGPARVYACEIKGELSLEENEIETALRSDAMRRHMSHKGLYSSRRSGEPRPMHKPERAAATRNWLSRLPSITQLSAA